MRFFFKLLTIALLVLGASLFFHQCKNPRERREEQARLDSLRRDSSRPAYNPYKVGQGTQVYDQQREVLGNLDSLVSPGKK